MPLLLIVFVCVAALPAWWIANGLRTGKVHTGMWPYRRTEEPVHFWAVIATHAGLLAWIAYLAGSLILSD